MISVSYIMFVVVSLHTVSADSMDDVKTLMADLMVNYSVEVRPVKDQNMSVNVDVGMSLVSINDFNEVNGVISLVAIVILSWKDESLVWDPSSYNDTTSLTLSQEKIWVPKMYLVNPASEFKPISNKHFKVTVLANGMVFWAPGGILEVTCTPDVSKFPFDLQTCSVSINAYGYTTTQVSLTTQVPTLNLSFFSTNSVWDIESTKSSVSSVIFTDLASFSITMSRRPLNFIINVVIPIIMLALVNPFVFILPYNSSERTSYSITVLLAFTVYMTVVSDRLPASSDPISNLSYYLLSVLGLSALIVTMNIFQIRTYSKDDEQEPVPQWMNRFIIYFRNICHNGQVKSEINVQQDKEQTPSGNEPIKSHKISSPGSVDETNVSSIHAPPKENDGIPTDSLKHENVTWYTVAKYTDKVYFTVCLFFTAVASLVYFIGATT